jgi:PAS domain S-box-containing protein
LITCVTIAEGVLKLAEVLKVLYVDDEPGLLDIGKLFLEEMGGFQVDIHTSAKAGLATLASAEYDAIISDYQMPGMDGIAFLKQVRSSGNTIPFILFTGRGREEIVIQALNEGADFYLQKGGEPESQFAELAHKIRLAVHQRRAETSIRDHERRESDIINFLPDATFAIDTNGVVIAWNRAMEDFSGIVAQDILGKGEYEYSLFLYHERRPILIDLVLKNDPEAEKRYPYVLHSGKKLYSEIFIPHLKNGAGALIWFTASPIYDTRGRVVGAIESIRDISDRKRAEEEVQFKNMVLLSQQETSPDAILIVDRAGKILQYNRKFVEIFGIPEHLVASRDDGPVLQHVTGLNADPAAFLARVKYLYDHPGEKSFEEFQLRDGRIIERYSSPMHGEGGGYFGRVWYFRDITGRKRAEEALVSEKNLTDAIFNSIPGMLYLYDAEGRLVRWNRNHELMTGYSAEELSRMQLLDWYRGDEKSQAAVNAGIRRTLETGFGEAEALLQRKDGTTIPMHFTASPLTLQGKQYFTGIGTDITERENARERQRIYTEHLLLAQKIGQTGSWQLNIATNIVWGSDEAFSMFGIHQPDNGLIPFEQVLATIRERGLFEQALRDLIDTGKEFNLEYSIETADHGITKFVHTVARVLKDTGNRPVWIAGVVQDITGRKEAEKALRASEEKYRTVLENIHDVFYRTDREGRLVMASPSWSRLFGYDTPEECLGSDIAKTFYYDPGKRQEFLRDITEKGRVDNYEVTLKRKDGTPVQVSTNSHLYYDEAGTVAGVEGILRDITALKEAQEETARQSHALAILNAIITTANRARDLAELLQVSLDTTLRLLDYEAGGIYLLDTGKQTATVAVARNLPEPFLEKIRTVAVDTAPYDALFLRGEPIITDNYSRVSSAHAGESGYVSLASIPLVAGTRIIGALNVVSSRRDTVTEDERALLLSIGRELGTTISRMVAEEEILLAQQEWERTFDTMPDPICLLDTKYTILRANRAMAEKFSLAPDQVVGRTCYELVHGTRSPPENCPHQRMLQDHQEHTAEICENGLGGSFLISCTPLLDKEGRLIGSVHVARDITDLKRTTDALRESEEKYRTVFETTGTATVLIEADGTISLANSEFERLTGFSKQEVENTKRWMEFVLPEDLERMLAQHRLRRQDPKRALPHYEFRLVTKSGELRNIFLTIDIIPGTQNSVASLLDVTERRNREEELLRTADELRAANEQIAATEEELRANLETLTLQERALRDSQKRLADIIEFLPDATFAIDTDGVVIAWNHALETMTGVKKEAVLGRGDHEYALPFYRERRPILVDLVLRYDESVAGQYPGLLREKDRFFAEVFLPHLNGGRGAHLWFTTSALYDSYGRIAGAIESIRDVTEHKEREAALNRKNEELGAAYEEITSTEEELRQQVEEIAVAQEALKVSEERMRNLFRNSPVAIAIYDHDGNLIDINPACCELFGIPSAEAVRGSNLFSNPQITPEKKEQLRSCHRIRFETDYDFGPVKELNVFPTTRSGIISIDVQIAPVRKSGGGTEYLVQIVDITERKRAEHALREEHGRLANIIRGTRAGTWEWNVQTGEATFNERWAEILGYTLDELAPVSIRTWMDFAHPDDLKRSESLLSRHFSGELPYYDCEARMRHKDGRWIWVQDRGQVITRTPDGKPLMMSGTHSDITELKGVEEALRETYRQLELLTSITRHDILNKVSTLLGYIKILEKKTSDPVLVEYIAKLAETAKAIRSQIEFTRIYEDLGTREPQWLEPGPIIAHLDVPGTLSLRSDLKGYAIHTDPMLEKVFFNLLDNTVRHGEHVTEVRVSASQKDGSLAIVWEDNGTGIPAEEKERIFGRGYGKNTGLGLFLSREILAITGITITEDGKPGSGARFTITVPGGAWRRNETA